MKRFLLAFLLMVSATSRAEVVEKFNYLSDVGLVGIIKGSNISVNVPRIMFFETTNGSSTIGNCTTSGTSILICGNPSGFSLRKAFMQVYSTGGRWFLKMNLNWSDSSATAGTLGINGVDFYDAANNGYTCSGWVTTAASSGFGSNAPVLVMTKTSSQIEFTTTGSHNFKSIFCDVPLVKKPSWAK